MTRGRAVLLMESNVIVSKEFNGDMYPIGHGDSFFEELSLVENKREFASFLNNFNKETFQYKGRLYTNLNNDEIYVDANIDEKIIDNLFFKDFTSDWVFVKNLSGKEVEFHLTSKETIVIKHGETIRFNFGKLNQDYQVLIQPNIIKEEITDKVSKKEYIKVKNILGNNDISALLDSLNEEHQYKIHIKNGELYREDLQGKIDDENLTIDDLIRVYFLTLRNKIENNNIGEDGELYDLTDLIKQLIILERYSELFSKNNNK